MNYSNRMFNRDILLQVTSRMNNQSLEALSHTSLWNIIKTFIQDQYFWYLRTQHLISMELEFTSACWKNIYYTLEFSIGDEHPFYYMNTSEVLAVKILLDLEHDPTETGHYALSRAAGAGHIDTVRLLLSDARIDPREDTIEGDALQQACREGHVDIVQLLLSDRRISPTNYTDESSEMVLACRGGHSEVVKLLLEDKRVDPTADNNIPLRITASEGHIEVMKLLLADKRICSRDRYLDLPIILACENHHTDMIELLLENWNSSTSDRIQNLLELASSRGCLDSVSSLICK